MPGWPGGLGNRLQDGRAAVDQGLGDRLQEPLDERGRPYLERNYLLARIAAAPSKLFGGLVVDPIVDAMTMAGDVQSGAQPTMAFDPQTGETGTSPQLAGRTLNAATILASGGLATAAGREGLGIFGGWLAKTANIERLTRASDMANGGFTPEEIWKETGWFKGADDKWKFEIPDDASRVTDKTIDALTQREWRGSKAGPAGEILEHPELYKAYPELQNIDTYVDYGVNYPSSSGRYDKGWPGDAKYFGRSPQINMELNALAGPEGPRSIMLHELQHPIQDIEGFAKGGSPDDFGGFGGYRRLAGEVEARNVQGRRRMTDEQRRAIPPWVTQDTPIEQQHMRFGGSGPQASIKAYHGSPHDFERFDSSKIGTGQGAQTFGHGIYAAENETVAKAYKDAGPASRAQYDEINNRMSELARVMGSDAIPGKGRVFKSDVGRKAAEEYDALMQKRENLGHMYEVDIAAEPEQFLDWDKPLAEQSPQVQQALGFREPGQIKALQAEIADIDSRAEAILKSSQLPTDDVDAFWKAAFADTPQNAEYDALIRRREELRGELQTAQKQMKLKDMGHMTGEAYLRGQSLARRSANDPEKARQLREAGVAGVQYLDQGSRSSGRGTRNYVVFDDKLISILRKYGLPISAAGLAALSQLHPQEAQAAPLGDRLQGR